jgi:hypothetical protein
VLPVESCGASGVEDGIPGANAREIGAELAEQQLRGGQGRRVGAIGSEGNRRHERGGVSGHGARSLGVRRKSLKFFFVSQTFEDANRSHFSAARSKQPMAENDRHLQLTVLRHTVKGRSWSHEPPTRGTTKETTGVAERSLAAPGAAACPSTTPDYERDADWSGGERERERERDLDELYFDEREEEGLDGLVAPLQLTNTFEDERGLGEVPTEKRIGQVTPPCVVARNDGPNKFQCYCCGEASGYDVQLPLNVFATAYRTSGGAVAIGCLVEMAQLLVRGDYEAVFKRTTCCKKLACLIGQDLLSADDWCTWIKLVGRPQLVRGTDRTHQSRIFSDNVALLRTLALQQPSILSKEELRALFEFLVLNSQFIQEREKRFIATAMAVVENPQIFTYRFADPQSLVEKMAQIPRNYASAVIFPHIVEGQLTPKKWVSKGNRILETAFPKAADALFAILCDDNAASHLYQEVDGRVAHRVPRGAPYLELFTVFGFRDALTKAVEASPKYTLRFSSERSAPRHVDQSRAQRDMKNMLAALYTTQRSETTTGKGAAAACTCGSQQCNSGVHPKDRYMGVFKALGLTDAEAEKRVAIFIDEHKTGNTVGFEKLRKGSHHAKACETIRPVEIIVPHVPTLANASRARLGQQMGMVALKRAKRA